MTGTDADALLPMLAKKLITHFMSFHASKIRFSFERIIAINWTLLSMNEPPKPIYKRNQQSYSLFVLVLRLIPTRYSEIPYTIRICQRMHQPSHQSQIITITIRYGVMVHIILSQYDV